MTGHYFRPMHGMQSCDLSSLIAGVAFIMYGLGWGRNLWIAVAFL